LAEIWGDGADWRHEEGHHLPEASELNLDCRKAARRLGWEPKLPLSSALEWVVEWYKAHGRGEDMRQITLGQITRYQELAG
jgi:CDP-glucose 4,6-dehydratase